MAKSFLEQILRDSDRMNELISDLLDLSSMESSDIEMEIIDLHEVISNEISYLSKQNKKRVGYKKSKAEIFANYDDISIAVKNLIKNALKYSPLEENIFIKTETRDSEIICSFQDFGSGISKADQEKIFERFYRSSKARAHTKGTGLGLALVKQLSARIGCNITVQSQINTGTEFFVSFKDK